ncbi:50S ribosomal protein L11 [Candidatus Woesearchaeota archaeon]|nr:50S ribosomal protein L11 [Candidatus Woesearchaeota archaeon]
MAKQSVEALIQGGKASAAPPLGPALGPLGVNIGQVVADINKKTEAFKGMQVPVVVEVDTDTKEFTISVGTPPASALIKQEASIQKGSGKPKEELLADLRIEQVIKVAKMKEEGLSGKTLKEKVKEIVGTCQSMGIMVEGMRAQEAQEAINAGSFDQEIVQEKTDISAEELKKLEEEKKQMQAELAEKHEKEEAEAKSILAAMEGKERGEIKAKMAEADISSEVIDKLLPLDVQEEEQQQP